MEVFAEGMILIQNRKLGMPQVAFTLSSFVQRKSVKVKGKVPAPRRKLQVFFLCTLSVFLIVLTQCATPVPGPTPTPTRTPQPTLTLTPSPTHTPSPTPTPAFPVTVGCAAGVPQELCQEWHALTLADPAHFSWTEDDAPTVALGLANVPNARPVGVWTYAVAAPFFTVTDTVSSTTLMRVWRGEPAETWGARPLLMTTDTLRVLSSTWGATSGDWVQPVAASELLTRATALSAWAILPFHHLVPKWKVLRVDGNSLLEKSVDMPPYPLTIPFFVGSASRPETLDLLSYDAPLWHNRDEARMTLLVMTGVTAMTRATAQLMERAGLTYPAQDIKPWFTDADFVHISNEVSFKEDCVAQGSGTMSFCSHDSYIVLLEEINANIIELTGNHLVDKGIAPLRHSFDLYRERGWQWYGGGENLTDASRPLTLTHGVNKIALLGCNTVDNPYDWATDDLPGVATCRLRDRQGLNPEKLDQMRTQIAELKAEGYQIIISLQYYETYEYVPYPQQIRDFRTFADLGADYVQGSQAHQAQTMEFYGDTFVHYGLGNFFFDQMWSAGTRQEFVNRLTFYDGRLLSIDVRPAILEEFGRPRPMTVGDPDPAADREQFLQMIFDLRPTP